MAEEKTPSRGIANGWIIGGLLCVSFVQAYSGLADSDWAAYSLLLGAVVFFFQSVLLMIAPLIIGISMRNLKATGLNILCAVNSLGVYGLSFVLAATKVFPSEVVGWFPAVVYFFINKSMLTVIKQRVTSRKKPLIIIGSVMVALVLLVGGGMGWYNYLLKQNILDNQHKELLVVAIVAENAPFSYVADDEYRGVHVDLSEEIAERLHCDVKFILLDRRTDEDDLVDAIEYGRYDLAFGIEQTPEREELVLFTKSYYEKMTAIFAKDGMANELDVSRVLDDMIKDGTVTKILSKYSLK